MFWLETLNHSLKNSSALKRKSGLTNQSSTFSLKVAIPLMSFLSALPIPFPSLTLKNLEIAFYFFFFSILPLGIL